MASRIPRKPVSRPSTNPDQLAPYDGALDDIINDYLEPTSPLFKTPSAVELNKQFLVASDPINRDLGSSGLRWQNSNPELISHPSEPPVSLSPAPDTLAPSRSKWQTVMDETAYFAGGLIPHPSESTKHYSILRHSPALVMYRGPSTSVTISVFGDIALPSDRSFWLQRKGFSGNMGMAASALIGTTSNWIDVTPSVESLATNVPESDERAWQRDISKFLKRATKDKRLSKHVIRETCVLRIPAVAADGYLRIVMCTGQNSKKSLCPSPTFRLASTSSDASVLRGASLATLPLEVGLKAASVVGNLYAQRVIGPAHAVMQSRMKQIEPAFVKKNAAKLAVAQGVREHFAHFEGNFDAKRDVTYSPFHEQGTFDEPPPIIGSDLGPEKPFPITFTGKVVPGTGISRAKFQVPTANLSNVSEELLLRLNGIYIGWAAVEPGRAAKAIEYGWHEAVITIGPSPYAPSTVAARRVATVHIISDFGETTTFFDSNLRVIIMAFLRPNSNVNYMTSPVDIAVAISRDREIAVASLNRDRWRYDMNFQAADDEQVQKSLTDRYVGFRSQVQRHIDSLPVHWAGVRTDRAELKDEAYGRGGFYIRR